MLGNIGPLEIGIVLVIALMVFGPKRLPELGGSLGKGIRDFGKGIKGEETEVAAVEAPVETEAR
jgi:TatA/E family protein of Tat protein translocase